MKLKDNISLQDLWVARDLIGKEIEIRHNQGLNVQADRDKYITISLEIYKRIEDMWVKE